MAINFKLSEVRPVLDPAGDPMHRAWVGYEPTIPAEELFEQNRGIWHLGARAEDERYATFSFNGKVVVVAEITGIEALPWPIPQERRAKKAITGRVLQQGHRAYQHFIGLLVDGHRNPVSYLEDPRG